jgi:hypothetical protein
MIKFSLVCSGGHEFESWFQNGAAFDAQAKASLVSCPICHVTQVTKAIMSPAIAYRSHTGSAPVQSTPQNESGSSVALLSSRDQELRAMIEGVRKRILEQTDNVGADFFEEAQKMHHGLAPKRAIHGLASFEEASALLEEGIGILPIPPLPGDYN